jgi:hypothetical protein
MKVKFLHTALFLSCIGSASLALAESAPVTVAGAIVPASAASTCAVENGQTLNFDFTESTADWRPYTRAASDQEQIWSYVPEGEVIITCTGATKITFSTADGPRYNSWPAAIQPDPEANGEATLVSFLSALNPGDAATEGSTEAGDYVPVESRITGNVGAVTACVDASTGTCTGGNALLAAAIVEVTPSGTDAQVAVPIKGSLIAPFIVYGTVVNSPRAMDLALYVTYGQ